MPRSNQNINQRPICFRPSICRGSGLALSLGVILTLGLIGTSVEAAPGVVVQDAFGEQDRPRRGVQGEFPTAEAVMQRLGPAVESGRMTREQMDQVMQIHRRFAMGVENGRMSSQEASTMFGERVRALMSGEGERREDDKDMTPASRMSALMLEVGNALKAGTITPEEAVNKVMAAARRMRINVGEEHVPTPADQRELRAQYAEAEKKMAAMLEKGEITREQMEERLGNIRRRMEAGHSGSKRTFTKAEYDEAAAKMAEMVKAGEITRMQMQERLDGMKRAMAAGGAKGANADREAYMERIGGRLKMAVENGDMTREEAGKKYAELEQEYDAKSPAKKEREVRWTRADYAAAQKEMQEMVDKGEITQEQMDQRLSEMRKMMGDR